MSKSQYKPRSYICQCKLEDGRICSRGFLNRSGLTQHINAKHRVFAAINSNPDRHRDAPDVNLINADQGFDDLMASGPAVPEGTDAPAQPARRTIDKHPLLDGKVLLSPW